jgi:hypothetical protein
MNRQGAKNAKEKQERKSEQKNCAAIVRDSLFVCCLVSFCSWRSRRLGGSFG